jgi:acetophenone carboxylase
MLAAMNRDPRTLILDIKARLAAARIVQRRIQEVIGEKGVDFFVGALRRVLTVTGAAARKKVAQLNDGIYRQPRFLDTVGEDNGLVKINLTVIKKGETITLNLENSSPMLIERPINSYFQGIIGLAMVYFCGWLFHDLPPNNGLLEAVDWVFPEGAMINASGDVATSMAPLVQVTFTHGMFQCGARMTYSVDPSRAVAPWFSGFAIPMFAGLNQFEEPIADLTPEINATGCGGRFDMDGVNAAGAFFATMADCSDVEATEADRPVIYTFRNYFGNSYGHGRYRGGAGLGFGLCVHDTRFFVLGSHGAGGKFPTTQGLFGGYGIPTLFVKRVTRSNYQDLVRESATNLPTRLDEVFTPGNPETGDVEYANISSVVKPASDGDTFYAYAGGGGGYGDPLERDPQSVIADLRNKLVMPEAARKIYGVVYDAHALRLDAAATEARRRAMREERKHRGKPYSVFVKEWSVRQPPQSILRFYGSYPHPGTSAAAHAAAAETR